MAIQNHGGPSAPDMAGELLKWSQEHLRELPWRSTQDAFAVLVAELMLRRTRAEQVVPVFQQFMELFPDAFCLASAADADVERTVRSLGLSWRTPAFKQVARAVVERHGGRVPDSYQALIELPGVGDYVAAAVLVFAFGQQWLISDTNTARVACRYFGYPYGPESRRNAQVRKATELLVDPRNPAKSAGALLDFATFVCRARTPRCDQCPFHSSCEYANKQEAA